MRHMRMPLIASLLAILVATAPMAGQSKAEVTLRAAVEKEQVEGDPKGALVLYEQAVQEAGANRGLAAKALLAKADVYRRLGDAQARESYQRVVSQYADQTAAVATARAQLARLGGGGSEVVIRKRLVYSGAHSLDSQYGKVSSDGRYLAYAVYQNDRDPDREPGGLFIHDYSGGADRQVVTSSLSKNRSQVDFQSVFSRDGKNLAYLWQNGLNGFNELRVVETKDSGASPRVLVSSAEIPWIEVHDWTPDGKWLAATVTRKDRTGQVALVSAEDGSVHVLKSVELSRLRDGAAMAFSPDGKYLAFDLGQRDSTARDILVLATDDASREIPVIVGNGDNALLGWSPDGRAVLFVSNRRGSEDLWAAPFHDGQFGEAELIQREVGQFTRLGMTASGTLYYMPINPAGGYLGRPGNVYGLKVASIDLATGQVVSPPTVVPQGTGIPSASWSHDGQHLAFIPGWRLSATLTDPVLKIQSVTTGQVRELKPRPALRILRSAHWSLDDRSLVVSGRDFQDTDSVHLPFDDLFRIDAQSGEVSLLVRGAAFLQWSGDGTKIYLARSSRRPENPRVTYDLHSLIERDLASGSERELFRTVGPRPSSAVSPDGRTLYLNVSGRLTARDLATGNERELSQSVTGLSLSPDGRSILATGDQRRALLVISVDGGEPRELTRVSAEPSGLAGLSVSGTWAADSRSILAVKNLPGPRQEYWWIPLNGDAPRRLDLACGACSLSGFQMNRDGRRISFVQREVVPTKPPEVWVLENFLPTAAAGRP